MYVLVTCSAEKMRDIQEKHLTALDEIWFSRVKAEVANHTSNRADRRRPSYQQHPSEPPEGSFQGALAQTVEAFHGRYHCFLHCLAFPVCSHGEDAPAKRYGDAVEQFAKLLVRPLQNSATDFHTNFDGLSDLGCIQLFRFCCADFHRFAPILAWPSLKTETTRNGYAVNPLLVACVILGSLAAAARWCDLEMILGKFSLQLSDVFRGGTHHFIRARAHLLRSAIPRSSVASRADDHASAVSGRSGCIVHHVDSCNAVVHDAVLRRIFRRHCFGNRASWWPEKSAVGRVQLAQTQARGQVPGGDNIGRTASALAWTRGRALSWLVSLGVVRDVHPANGRVEVGRQAVFYLRLFWVLLRHLFRDTVPWWGIVGDTEGFQPDNGESTHHCWMVFLGNWRSCEASWILSESCWCGRYLSVWSVGPQFYWPSSAAACIPVRRCGTFSARRRH